MQGWAKRLQEALNEHQVYGAGAPRAGTGESRGQGWHHSLAPWGPTSRIFAPYPRNIMLSGPVGPSSTGRKSSIRRHKNGSTELGGGPLATLGSLRFGINPQRRGLLAGWGG